MADKNFEVLDGLVVSGNAAFDTNVLFVDSVANRVGINKTPTQALDVTGNIYSSANVVATANVSGNFILGNGSQLTNMPYLSNTVNSTLGSSAVLTVSTATINVVSGSIKFADSQNLQLGTNGIDNSTFSYDSATTKLNISGSNVAIDTDTLFIDTSADKISVNGTIDTGASYVADFTGNFRTKGNIDATGDITAYASDIKLKTNLQEIENALDMIDQVGAYHFEWNKEKCDEAGFTPNRDAEHGVIAQEIEKIMPDLVVNSAFSNEYKTVRYDRLTVLLLAAVKELKKEIDQMKSNMCCQ